MALLNFASIVIALLVGSAASQESGWMTPGQINATMCFWDNPRAAVVRDTLYIDGGYLWWLPGLASGLDGIPTQDGNPLGIVYSLNFSQPFNTSSNFSNVFEREFKGPNDQQAASFGPQFLDGVLFGNNYDWLGYGGLVVLTDSVSAGPSTESTAVEGFQVFTDGTAKRAQPGFYDESLPTGMTRYVTYGGGVSIPDLNLGYYFGGLRAADFGPIYYEPSNGTLNADVLSNTLITVNMAGQQEEKWQNLTVPSTIPGRASPELVWVPVAESGALIAIGGVILPEYDNPAQSDTATQAVDSNTTSSKFMETVAVYNIAKATWYLQDTSGTTPPATAEGCTVVASASDGSSHNIYWYGGFNGIDATTPFFDDVYVLSVPSFTWTKLYNGTASHGRAGHRCSKPYPDQMFVVGGYPSEPGDGPSCLEGGILQIFNLSSGEFIESYNPTVWTEYAIPSAVSKVIGGSATGGATLTNPPSWANSDLATLFGSLYSGIPVTDWFPYPLNETSPSSSPLPAPKDTIVTHSSGLPSWVAPVLGVVLGLMTVTAIVVIFLLWRRRRYLQSHQSEEGTSDLNRHRIMSWVRGMPTDTTTKAATVTTDETPETNFNDADILDKNVVIVEAASNTVHEMMDTSRPQELSDTGLAYTNLSASASDASRMSGLSGMSGMTYASRRLPRASGTPRPESPSLGNTQLKRTKSGISSMGSGHHHQVSEVGSVDSASTGQTSALRTPEMAQHQTFFSPVSPPTPQNGEASDYMNAGGASRPLIEKDSRRSNFEEDLDE